MAVVVIVTSVLVDVVVPLAGAVTNTTGMPGAVTTSAVWPEMLPAVAETTLTPDETPVAKPLLLIVTLAVSDEAQVTELVRFCDLLSEYLPVAVNCRVAPAAIGEFAGVTTIEVSVGVCACRREAPTKTNTTAHNAATIPIRIEISMARALPAPKLLSWPERWCHPSALSRSDCDLARRVRHFRMSGRQEAEYIFCRQARCLEFCKITTKTNGRDRFVISS